MIIAPSEIFTALAIYTRNEEVLILQKKRGWTFPGGKFEPGEDALMAAGREGFEETNLQGSNGKVIGQKMHPKTGKTIFYVHFAEFTGRLNNNEPKKHIRLAWIKASDRYGYLGNKIFAPVDVLLQYLSVPKPT